MKKILTILTMIASLTFTSCEDFLTEEVRGQQNLDTYFQSDRRSRSIYYWLLPAITFGGWWNINTVWLLSEMCSDDGWMGGAIPAKVKVTIFLWPTIKVPDKAMVPSPTFGSIDTKAFYVAISQWNAFHKLISQMKK